jgi:hypothetical protein
VGGVGGEGQDRDEVEGGGGEGQNRAGVARVDSGKPVADTCTHTFTIKTLLPLLLLLLLCCLPGGVEVVLDVPLGLELRIITPVGSVIRNSIGLFGYCSFCWFRARRANGF